MTVLRGENDNENRRDQDRRKGWENAIVAVWIVTLMVASYWLIDAFIKSSREQECLARGGRTCINLEISIPAR